MGQKGTLMWTCTNCKEEIEDSFDNCWKCGTGKDGSPANPDFLNQSKQNTKKNPTAPETLLELPHKWLRIWYQPRKVVRNILDNVDYGQGDYIGIIIFLTFGLLGGLSNFKDSGIIGLFIGPIIGAITFYIHSKLLWRFGNWFGGKGRSNEMYTALGWSTVILLQGLLVTIIVIFAYDKTFVLSDELLDYANLPLLIPLGILVLWSTYIQWQTIAEAHRFSVVKGFLTSFISFFMLSVLPEIIFLTVIFQSLFRIS